MVRVDKAVAEKLRKRAEQSGITMGQVVAQLLDDAPTPQARTPAAARSPAAPSLVPPATEQKTPRPAVLSHAALELKPKAYDYFTGLSKASRDWLYPRLKDAVSGRVLLF
jgi:hypothetical protein